MFEIRSHYIAQAVLELEIFLPQPTMPGFSLSFNNLL
jgi:hypothetical protein